MCHLCLTAIDLALVWPDPECFTRDHLIPRAHGGSDDLANLKPAHRRCNEDRGTRAIVKTPYGKGARS